MAYVDLNPARAAMCDTLADSDFTSIQRRLRERDKRSSRIKPGRSLLDRPLRPVAGLDADALLDMTKSTYIELVQWTGEQSRLDKRDKLKPLIDGKGAAPSNIWLVANHPKDLVHQVHGTANLYYRAIGSAEALMEMAESLGQVWMEGVAGEVARKILRERPT